MTHSMSRPFTLCLALGALACLSAPVSAQFHEDFDSYAPNKQVVGQGGWQEWGPGAGAIVSSAKSLSPGNSIDIKGASDLVHQYSGITSGTWEYTAMQYIPKTFTGKTYFILLSSWGSTNKWAVQVAFNKTTGNVEPDAGKSGSKATTPIIYDKWVPIRVLIHLDADWVQFYYNGKLLDDATVPNHATLGGGWKWTGGPFGSTNGPKALGALDLFANKATSVYYDEITLQPATGWQDSIDTYLPKSQVDKQGGWEPWGPGAGAVATNAVSRGPGNSIDIKAAADLVHQYKGYTKGTWEYTAWQYIPKKTFTGKTYFILLSSWGTTNKWAVQVAFNKTTGNVEPDAGKSGSKATTPIIYDKWVPIQVMIHLDADWVQFYYNGKLLDDATVADHPTLGGGWKWTGGPFGSSNGPKAIGAVDLFANKATSVYYDDFRLRPVPNGIRNYGMATAGSAGDPQIYATGDAVLTNTKFAVSGRTGLKQAGLLAITAKAIPNGIPVVGFNLLVDPNPVYVPIVVTSGVAGGVSVPLPLIPKLKGKSVFAQFIWIDKTSPVTLSASDGLEIRVQ